MGKSQSAAGTTEAKAKKQTLAPAINKNVAKFLSGLSKLKAIGTIAFVVGVTIALDGWAATGSGSFAMLYLLANNGRLSGRADGNVYQRNGRVRSYFTPSLVQNVYTQTARVLLSSLSSAWNSISQANRESFLNMEWLSKSDRFGQSILIKGKDAFVALNSNLALIGASPIGVAPLDSGGVASITSASTIADQSTPDLTTVFSPTPTDTDVDHLIFATRVMSPGTSRPKQSAYRVIGTIAGGTASGVDLQIDYENKYGGTWATDAGNLGGKIFFKARPINNITGAAGADFAWSSGIVA